MEPASFSSTPAWWVRRRFQVRRRSYGVCGPAKSEVAQPLRRYSSAWRTSALPMPCDGAWGGRAEGRSILGCSRWRPWRSRRRNPRAKSHDDFAVIFGDREGARFEIGFADDVVFEARRSRGGRRRGDCRRRRCSRVREGRADRRCGTNGRSARANPCLLGCFLPTLFRRIEPA